MKQTFFNTQSDGQTALSDSQRKEVLFFANAHFLIFNFTANAHCTHLPLLADTQASPKAKSKEKECNRQRTIITNELYSKMKKLVIFILILSGLLNQSYGQSSYRIKPFADKGDFIYPPHSKLKHSCKKTTVKKSCRYQYIYMDSLKMTHGDYYSVLNLLNKAEYFSSRHSIDKICFDTECYGCDDKTKGTSKPSFEQKKRKQNSKSIEKLKTELKTKIRIKTLAAGSKICDITKSDSLRFCKLKYSYDQKAFLLQIDYQKIFTDNSDYELQKLKRKYDAKKTEFTAQLSEANAEANAEATKKINKTISELTKKYEYDISEPGIIEARFFELAKELIMEFNKRERTGTAKEFGWPTSISQNIIEKIFELIPIPSQSSLSRYIAQIDDEKSFVLLNPKIKLKVDAVEKVKDGDNWYFNLVGTTIVTINRNNQGDIIQNPFHKFQVKGMPDNTAVYKPDGEPDIIHQASSEDIQLSETLRDKPYLFLYQNDFKANIGTPGNKVCAGTYDDRFDCNSMLVHYSNLTRFFNDKKNDLSLIHAEYISSFGFRNLITPIIDITVNGNLIQCPLGLSFNELRNQISIPLSFNIYRFWNGRYVKIKNINIDNLILLPNDKITF